MPQRVPLISIPVYTGYNIVRDVSFCLELVKPLFKSVRLCLFERWFYSNELMIALNKVTVPYLIFVPKNDAVKRALVLCNQSEGDRSRRDSSDMLRKMEYRNWLQSPG